MELGYESRSGRVFTLDFRNREIAPCRGASDFHSSFKEQFLILPILVVILFTSFLWCLVMLTPTTCSYSGVGPKSLPSDSLYSGV